MTNNEAELREQLLELMPCIDSMCDKNGTTVGGTMDDPEPYQCQFCYEARFPAVDQIMHLITEQTRKARIDELEQITEEPRRTADSFDGSVYVFKTARIDDRLEALNPHHKAEE